MSKMYGIGDEEELAEDLQKELPNKIIAELKRIKAEIYSEIYQGSYFNNSGLRRAIDIIDREISELKGEQK